MNYGIERDLKQIEDIIEHKLDTGLTQLKSDPFDKMDGLVKLAVTNDKERTTFSHQVSDYFD